MNKNESLVPVVIPASAGSYEVVSQSEDTQIIKFFPKMEETLKGTVPEPTRPDRMVEFKDNRKVVLTNEGTTFDEVSLVEEKPFELNMLEGRKHGTFILKTGSKAEIVDERGKVVSQLQKGIPVTIPVEKGLSITAEGGAVVKIMYPER